jgi:DNA-binding NtrC family response regulator
MVVDDDERILFAFCELMKKEGCQCIEARDGLEAIQKLTTEKPAVVFMDVTMPNLDGLEALKQIKTTRPAVPVIIITGQGTMQTAIKAMQLGAFEYLSKPLSVDKIRDVIRRARLSTQIDDNGNSFSQHLKLERYELLGNSAAMQEIYKLIGSVSTTSNETPVLITGESGTGKELVARALHQNGANFDEPFVAINCTALPETLLESELFGHEKGTFTGATERKLGKFELAHRGTIFLDEIGDLPAGLQMKLLRVLQEREIDRIGGNKPIPVEARFVAATNQDIKSKVTTGVFREDLFYRLHVVEIHLPPLREHREDIPLLVNYFLDRYNRTLSKTIKGFTNSAIAILHSYSYPGNVRELKNLVERAMILTQGALILPDVLSDVTANPAAKTPLAPFNSAIFSVARQQTLDNFEKQFVLERLRRHNGNVTAAARSSKMSRQNFHRLMQKHGVNSANTPALLTIS